MGTTFVGVDDERGFWMRDGILELFLRFAALHIEDPTESDRLPSTIRDQWLLASRGFFNGCVPHNLPECVATPEGKEIVRKAIRSLLDALATAPDELPVTSVNLMGFEDGWTRPIETWRLVETGNAFLALIDGKIGAPPSDTTFMPGSR